MWPALLLLQGLTVQGLVQLSQAELRADLVLRRADEGRQLAGRFICEDESRYRRLQELDDRFDKLRQAFGTRFGHGWQPGSGTTNTGGQSIDGLSRRDDCRLRDSFAAGLIDYENGLLAAQAELGTAR